jgi:hypothetical protein
MVKLMGKGAMNHTSQWKIIYLAGFRYRAGCIALCSVQSSSGVDLRVGEISVAACGWMMCRRSGAGERAVR